MNRTFLTLVIVIGLIAIPVAAGSAMLNSMVGIFGSLTFAASAIVAARMFPVRRWLAVSICGIVVSMITVILYRASTNEIIVDNRSGQEISNISIQPRDGNYGFDIDGIPDGCTARFKFNDLFFDGRFNVAGGSLHDGSRLSSFIGQIEGGSYHRRSRIIIAGGGKIRAIWE